MYDMKLFSLSLETVVIIRIQVIIVKGIFLRFGFDLLERRRETLSLCSNNLSEIIDNRMGTILAAKRTGL